ncbi:hypothetical protein GCM10010452_35380 [Crossiella cryophila]|uniref:Uncharacterized protein n=1 Tax=Crossiella cryophila TaxID=43355 RepID=A0A7W7C8L9_9PSEU|nr:hypothetical protein [Crossiella cryophila]
MRIRTDDEVYRVDAVWLGPPKATFPWRARYVAWGVGLVVFLLVLAVERRMGFGFSFFSTAWAIIITVVITRIICSRINQERPLGAVSVMWLRELTAPRQTTSGNGGAATAARIRVNSARPRPKPKKSEQKKQRGKSQSGSVISDGSVIPDTAVSPDVSAVSTPSGHGTDAPSPSSPSRRGRSRRARTKEVRGVPSPTKP